MRIYLPILNAKVITRTFDNKQFTIFITYILKIIFRGGKY